MDCPSHEPTHHPEVEVVYSTLSVTVTSCGPEGKHTLRHERAFNTDVTQSLPAQASRQHQQATQVLTRLTRHPHLRFLCSLPLPTPRILLLRLCRPLSCQLRPIYQPIHPCRLPLRLSTPPCHLPMRAVSHLIHLQSSPLSRAPRVQSDLALLLSLQRMPRRFHSRLFFSFD